MSKVMLKLNGISKTYGDVQALKPLSLNVREGEMLSLLGPSGCGKTTTLRIIAGFETPDTGSVIVNSQDITDLPANKRAIGMVFQNYSLFPHMSVGKNVGFGLKVRGISRNEINDRVQSALRMVRLEAFQDREIHQLSGGQQQRVALARALVTNPTLLLLDEPLGALDKNLRERMQFELRELQRNFGVTSILVTHDQEEALTMSDRLAVMSEGRIVQVGSPTEVYERPQSAFVSEFLGTSNILEGTVVRNEKPGLWAISFNFAGRVERLAMSAVPLTVGSKVKIAVRPERLHLDESDSASIKVRILDRVFRGSYFAYEMSATGVETPLFYYSQTRRELTPDKAFSLEWDPQHAIVLEH